MTATFSTLLKKELSFLKVKELANRKLLESEYRKGKEHVSKSYKNTLVRLEMK
jgi:hypothetical protein